MLEENELLIFKVAFSIFWEYFWNTFLDSLTLPNIIYWHQFEQNMEKKSDLCFSTTVRGWGKEKEMSLKVYF